MPIIDLGVFESLDLVREAVCAAIRMDPDYQPQRGALEDQEPSLSRQDHNGGALVEAPTDRRPCDLPSFRDQQEYLSGHVERRKLGEDREDDHYGARRTKDTRLKVERDARHRGGRALRQRRAHHAVLQPTFASGNFWIWLIRRTADRAHTTARVTYIAGVGLSFASWTVETGTQHAVCTAEHLAGVDEKVERAGAIESRVLYRLGDCLLHAIDRTMSRSISERVWQTVVDNCAVRHGALRSLVREHAGAGVIEWQVLNTAKRGAFTDDQVEHRAASSDFLSADCQFNVERDVKAAVVAQLVLGQIH